MKAAFLAVAVLATAGVVFYFATAVHAAKASGPGSAEQRSAAHKALSSKSLSLPLFFEPNQGQTAPQVKFLARGAGYSLFLTADEAVLELHRAAGTQHSALSSQLSAVSSQRASSAVIRMRLDGANASARVSGASPLPGKSNYFIGNDPSKWRRDIPQFARVQYQAVYPGVDLVYYGNQGQLEYDFRVAPGAEPSQIALSFNGASARIDSGDSGDLILATANGDVRFHAPRIYQPAAPESGNASGNSEKAITGSFRQLAGNKIGFTIGDYDHSRELVIDPTLSYSTFLGGSGTEGLVKVAVDSGGLIYVAGSTNSTDFPTNIAKANNPNNPPYQLTLAGAQNIFIAVINTTLQPPLYSDTQQLVYATYLGGSGVDSLAGVAVDSAFSIYVAGTTTSTDFPTTSNAFQTAAIVQANNGFPGTHGFLSKISNVSPTQSLVYNLAYSTYLAGNGTDNVTGLAIDATNRNAYVTGDTTSSNAASDGFPANPNGYQTASNSPGNPQFFASQINTNGSGFQSMLYSTYFGGGYPVGATAVGGGIAVDPTSTNVNMYITGTTNMLQVNGPNGEPKFPLFDAQQSCLNEASKTTACNSNNPTTNTDAFVAKINPNYPGSNPVYSTYLGGSGSDVGLAIAVDSSSNAYITGSTNSADWVCSCSGFQTTGYGGNGDAFIAKIGNLSGSVYPLTYFTYLGGSGPDSGQDIKVDSVQAAHVVGSTASPDLLLTTDALQTYGGQGDAFVALIGTTLSGRGAGDYLTYLGGSQLDQGTGIALDTYNATYVAGNTLSPNFPVTSTAYQPQLNGGSQDAFVSKIGAASTLTVTAASTSPSPYPVAAGTQVAFTFDITNTGPDNASFVTFYAVVPTTGLASSATAKVTSGTGNCTAVQGATIACSIPTLTVGAVGAVEVDVTPSATVTPSLPQINVSGSASANNGATQSSYSQTVPVVDFAIGASPAYQQITAGNPASIQVSFCPTSTQYGYSATITPGQTTSPSMVTATTPTFNPTTVTLSGSACGTTTLSIATVARPVTTGSLLRRGSFYAAWLPIGGLSLVGLGIGAVRKRRGWLVGVVLGVIAGVILLQSGCGSSSTSTTTAVGTAAGRYAITIVGSAGTGASHSQQVYLYVN
ncbi:MAG: SBBP repeat-containing protein [Terriglobales bacterium]